MAVIKAKKVEFEVLKQDINDAASKFMITLSYEPEGLESKEILNIVLCDETPYISLGVETTSYTKILQRTGPEGHHPDDDYISSPEDLYFNYDRTKKEKTNEHQEN